MLPTIALSPIENRSSLITWRIGGIEDIARNGIDRIDGEEPLPKTFTPRAIPGGIDGFSNLLRAHSLHA